MKPHCTEVGPTRVRLVKPRYTAYPMGIRNKMMSSPKAGVISATLLHWKRSLSWRVFQSRPRSGPMTASALNVDAVTGPSL